MNYGRTGVSYCVRGGWNLLSYHTPQGAPQGPDVAKSFLQWVSNFLTPSTAPCMALSKAPSTGMAGYFVRNIFPGCILTCALHLPLLSIVFHKKLLAQEEEKLAVEQKKAAQQAVVPGAGGQAAVVAMAIQLEHLFLTIANKNRFERLMLVARDRGLLSVKMPDRMLQVSDVAHMVA